MLIIPLYIVDVIEGAEIFLGHCFRTKCWVDCFASVTVAERFRQARSGSGE